MYQSKSEVVDGVLRFRAENLNLFLACPTIDMKIHTETAAGIMSTFEALASAGGAQMRLTFFSDSLIHRLRNRMLDNFLRKTDCSHMLMVDSDMGWDGKAVLRLIAADKPLIGIAGRRKVDKPSYCFNPVGGEGKVGMEIPWTINMEPPLGLVEVDEIGTGFLLIRRDCAERMTNAYPELQYKETDGEMICGLFDTFLDKKAKVFWSEDYMFCRRWRNIGGKVYCDPYGFLKHVGQKSYDGALINTFELKGEGNANGSKVINGERQ